VKKLTDVLEKHSATVLRVKESEDGDSMFLQNISKS